jgi:ubiquinone/menaquinone biosynthesis C-methylase UbiE
MLKNLLLNARNPKGIGGSIMIWSMNLGHSVMAKWGLSHIVIKPDDHILDIGCGGGRNIKRMLTAAFNGKVCGLDYSALSVEKSKKYNKKAIAQKRCEIKQGSVSQIPYEPHIFDIVTAFETVYFWPDFKNDLKEILRTLKSGGTLFICNEVVRMEGKEPPQQYFTKILDMKIYSPNDFLEMLSGAGFIDIQTVLSPNNTFVCVIAKKPLY